jgi:hypothetical protein
MMTMIQDEIIAKQVLRLTENAQAVLMNALEIVRANCTEQEIKKFQAEIAQVKGRLFFNVMEPLYRDHPALAPPDTPPEFIERWNTRKDRG